MAFIDPVTGMLVATGVGSAVQGIFGARGSNKQQRAAEAALHRQEALARENRQTALDAGERARSDIFTANANAIGALQSTNPEINRLNNLGFELQRQQLNQGFGSAGNTLGSLSELADYADIVANPNAIGRRDVVNGTGLRLNSLLNQQPGLSPYEPQSLSEGFDVDPGYQFRLQQGEEGIERSQAARGGRFGGAALKELERFRQGLASQEFNNFTNRRAQETGLNLQGRGQDLQNLATLGSLANQADARQLQARVSQAGFDQQRDLANQANLLSLAGTGFGATRQQAANQSMLGQLLGGSTLGQYQTEASNTGNLANQLASIYSGQGTTLANIGQNAAGQAVGATNAVIPHMQFPTQFAGGGTQAVGNAINTGVNNLAQLYAYSQFEPRTAA